MSKSTRPLNELQVTQIALDCRRLIENYKDISTLMNALTKINFACNQEKATTMTFYHAGIALLNPKVKEAAMESDELKRIIAIFNNFAHDNPNQFIKCMIDAKDIDNHKSIIKLLDPENAQLVQNTYDQWSQINKQKDAKTVEEPEAKSKSGKSVSFADEKGVGLSTESRPIQKAGTHDQHVLKPSIKKR